MKSLFSLIFLFLFANSAVATNLCDTSCNLTISFPSGGSIEATEALTFIFGTGGTLGLGATGTINVAVPPANTDFSAGGALALTVGESISFDAGGSLDLGTGGNLDYTNITVTTDGNIGIQSVGGLESILLNSITVIGTGALTITGATIDMVGGISTGGDIFLNTTDSTSVTCTTSSDGSITVSTTTTSTLSTCNTTTLGGIVTFTPTTLGGIVTSTSTTTTINTIDIGTINLHPTEMTIDGVLYQIEYKMVDGMEVQVFISPDGTTGTVELKDGKFVFVPDAKESSGTVGFLVILSLLITPILFRRQGSCFCIR